jgi:hypothetical protein
MNRPKLWISACLAVAGFWLWVGPAQAVSGVSMGNLGVPLDVDHDTLIDVNNIAMFVTNEGGFARDLESPGGPSGLFFPRGTDKTAVYAAGLWFGSQIGGDVRVTVAEYGLEYQPGRIYPDGTYDNPADSRLRVYKLVKGNEASADYLEWPVADGAPVNPDGTPGILGDQTLWAVYNDAEPGNHGESDAGNSDPQNIEVQQTTFAFDRPAPLGNMIFVKLKIFNRGQETLQDCFVSIWSDPDLGGAGDDLVGCDTLLSLGYCYNDTNDDEIYRSAPPAVGYDFFQGPIVPSPGDTAYVSGQPVPDYRNLPMTSFNKYINGTDPSSATDSYNYMQGFNRDGSRLRVCTLPDGSVTEVTAEFTAENCAAASGTVSVTRFAHSGNPVERTGWLDDNAADRRLMLNSGPFVMAPGDSQEVVVAIIVAQGTDRLASLDLLKLYDEQAQAVFDVNFLLPSSPPRPTLFVRPYDEAVDLIWSTDAVGDVQISEELDEEYHHEGYNLYQGESIVGPWRKIFTWDVENDIALIYADVFDVNQGGQQRIITQAGSNSGLAHHIRLTQDAIRGGPLRNYNDYFYALTAYSYEVRHDEPFFIGVNQVGTLTTALENSPQGVVATPKSSAAVLEVAGERVSGTSDGSVRVEIVDPMAVRPGTYDVTFREIEKIVIDEGDTSTVTVVVWDAVNGTTGDTLLAAQEFQASDPNEFGYLEADGLIVRVLGPAPGFKRNGRDPSRPMIDEIIHGDGEGGGTPVAPDVWGGPGNDLWWSINSTSEWGFSAGGGNGDENRFHRDGTDLVNLTAADIIMKWDYADDNWGWWVFNDGSWAKIPFGLYLKDPVTGEETRLVPAHNSADDTPGVYGFEGATDGQFGATATDWTYAYTFDGDWEALVADVEADGVLDNDTTNLELFARLVVFANVDPPVLPPDGTVIQFSTTKPNTPLDHFRFTIGSPGTGPGTVVGNDLKAIRAVPNPYLNQSAYELNQFDRIVRFINLPSVPATIRIFNLGGELVRTIQKEDPISSVAVWDLENSEEIPVASGIYIFHVDAKGIGSHVGKMAVFIEKERLNRF